MNESYKSRYKVLDIETRVDLQFPEDLLLTYSKHDDLIKENKIAQIFQEKCLTKDNKLNLSSVLKFPVFANVDRAELIAIGGIELSL